jgi:hypothetical protein
VYNFAPGTTEYFSSTTITFPLLSLNYNCCKAKVIVFIGKMRVCIRHIGLTQA